jgi:hypothetical protein
MIRFQHPATLGFPNWLQSWDTVCKEMLLYTGLTPVEADRILAGGVAHNILSESDVIGRIKQKLFEGETAEGGITEAIGSGYGFFLQKRAPLSPCVSLTAYKGVVYDPVSHAVRACAGSTMAEVQGALNKHRRTLPTCGDFSGVSVGAAIYTFVHGSSSQFNSIVDVCQKVKLIHKHTAAIEELVEHQEIVEKILSNDYVVSEATFTTIADVPAIESWSCTYGEDAAFKRMQNSLNSEGETEFFVYPHATRSKFALVSVSTEKKPDGGEAPVEGHYLFRKAFKALHLSAFTPKFPAMKRFLHGSRAGLLSELRIKFPDFPVSTRLLMSASGNMNFDSEFFVVGEKKKILDMLRQVWRKLSADSYYIIRRGRDGLWIEIQGTPPDRNLAAHRRTHTANILDLLENAQRFGFVCIPHRGKWGGQADVMYGKRAPYCSRWSDLIPCNSMSSSR